MAGGAVQTPEELAKQQKIKQAVLAVGAFLLLYVLWNKLWPVLVAAGIAAFFTKPEESTFEPWFRANMQEWSKQQGLGGIGSKLVGLFVAAAMPAPVFMDYYVCRLAYLGTGQGREPHIFVGVFNTWKLIKAPKDA
jgi:hypothetical protein